jgi:hypothetical protein
VSLVANVLTIDGTIKRNKGIKNESRAGGVVHACILSS